ncbi:unnamed protein product [Closterium sp. Naga37s-1]|nr:unnamed protein product [Closterium sp. Naga37s-1]
MGAFDGMSLVALVGGKRGGEKEEADLNTSDISASDGHPQIRDGISDLDLASAEEEEKEERGFASPDSTGRSSDSVVQQQQEKEEPVVVAVTTGEEADMVTEKQAELVTQQPWDERVEEHEGAAAAVVVATGVDGKEGGEEITLTAGGSGAVTACEAADVESADVGGAEVEPVPAEPDDADDIMPATRAEEKVWEAEVVEQQLETEAAGVAAAATGETEEGTSLPEAEEMAWALEEAEQQRLAEQQQQQMLLAAAAAVVVVVAAAAAGSQLQGAAPSASAGERRQSFSGQSWGAAAGAAASGGGAAVSGGGATAVSGGNGGFMHPQQQQYQQQHQQWQAPAMSGAGGVDAGWTLSEGARLGRTAGPGFSSGNACAGAAAAARPAGSAISGLRLGNQGMDSVCESTSNYYGPMGRRQQQQQREQVLQAQQQQWDQMKMGWQAGGTGGSVGGGMGGSMGGGMGGTGGHSPVGMAQMVAVGDVLVAVGGDGEGEGGAQGGTGSPGGYGRYNAFKPVVVREGSEQQVVLTPVKRSSRLRMAVSGATPSVSGFSQPTSSYAGGGINHGVVNRP